MKLSNLEKSIEISIDSYEFPYHETNEFHDNNWLNVLAICEDEVLVEDGINPCLLTLELIDLQKGLSNVLIGKEYESSFTEPDFYVHAKVMEEQVEMQISFRLPNRHVFEVHAQLSYKEVDEMVSEVKTMCEAFPIRENRMLN